MEIALLQCLLIGGELGNESDQSVGLLVGSLAKPTPTFALIGIDSFNTNFVLNRLLVGSFEFSPRYLVEISSNNKRVIFYVLSFGTTYMRYLVRVRVNLNEEFISVFFSIFPNFSIYFPLGKPPDKYRNFAKILK